VLGLRDRIEYDAEALYGRITGPRHRLP
jgi:hypothetical protein